MAPATDAEQQHIASGCSTSDHSAKMIPMQWAEFESKQAMTSLYIASEYMENETTTVVTQFLRKIVISGMITRFSRVAPRS